MLWRSENLANYLTKGKQVYVEGRLQTRNYEDKDGKKVFFTEVVAEDVLLLGGRGDGSGAGVDAPQASALRGPQRVPAAPAEETSAPGSAPITDDDVPF